MATVQGFKVFDINTGEKKLSSLKGTEKAIKAIKDAEIVPGTAEDVDQADLDGNEMYDPRKRNRGTKLNIAGSRRPPARGSVSAQRF